MDKKKNKLRGYILLITLILTFFMTLIIVTAATVVYRYYIYTYRELGSAVSAFINFGGVYF